MPDQPEQVSRFRRADEQTCQAREYDSFDKLAVHVEYLLARCDLQAEEIKQKVRAYPSLPADLRPAALRELKDNVKALETGVVRHGSDASVFRNTEMRGLTHELSFRSVVAGKHKRNNCSDHHCCFIDHRTFG